MYGKDGVITMSKKQQKSKYTVDDIPVKSITNGMIVLDNNQKVTGVKILPRNIFISDYGTQSAIIDNLKNVYMTYDQYQLQKEQRSEQLGQNELEQLIYHHDVQKSVEFYQCILFL